MTNSNWDNEEIAKALQRHTRADYFKTHIKEQFQEITAPLFGSSGLLRSEAVDTILLLIFTHIDLLGYLYARDSSVGNSSKNAVKFLREYLGRIDARYAEVGGLLYEAFRHGYVHLATPKRIQLNDGTILDFSFAFAGERQEHLKVTPKRAETEMAGRVEICRLSVNLSYLYEDLISAMGKYGEDLRHNQELSDIFWRAFETRRKPERATEEKLINKPYIQQSDFDFVRAQISNL